MKNLWMFIMVGLLGLATTAFINAEVSIAINRETTIDSLGACQGVAYLKGRVFLYGDRETGVIREFKLRNDSLVYINKEYKLTLKGEDVIGHPTGIAYHGTGPAFIGNSVRLNAEGTRWKAVIYQVNWKGLLQTGTLNGNLLSTIDDDACIQGARPEYVQYNGKWYVATADYGDHGNEVRLYDSQKLAKCKKTSEAGVLFKKFTCTPWVQNLYWVASKGVLILIQNQVEGRKWRFTYVDFAKSVAAGKMQVIKQVDLDNRADELEGFTFLNDIQKGIAVTSARKNNVNYTTTKW
jgi:hypothetical protein